MFCQQAAVPFDTKPSSHYSPFLMTWQKLLQPDLVLPGTILTLTPEILYCHNLKALVLDVDETLLPTRRRDVSDELIAWITCIRQVVPLWLVSNNISEVRIRRIAGMLEVPYVFGAGKPSRRKLKQAVVALGLPVEQIGMVGDRFFTDVLAGNRMGMFTILVQPMVPPNETPNPCSMHNLEVFILQGLGASIASKQINASKRIK
jgi:hypothetical protein